MIVFFKTHIIFHKHIHNIFTIYNCIIKKIITFNFKHELYVYVFTLNNIIKYVNVFDFIIQIGVSNYCFNIIFWTIK
jgi:hypothetical protein